jgi:predicted transcriptional regulator
VKHRRQGRQFLYRAAVSRRRTVRRVLARLTSTLFGGDVPTLVSQLLDSRRIDRQEIDEMRRLIDEKERSLR